MRKSLNDAVRRLEAALGQLEAAASRRLAAEHGRGDLETELQLMQDDRARLAVELDGTTARLQRFEAVTADVDRRVQRALGAVLSVLDEAPPPDRPGDPAQNA